MHARHLLHPASVCPHRHRLSCFYSAPYSAFQKLCGARLKLFKCILFEAKVENGAEQRPKGQRNAERKGKGGGKDAWRKWPKRPMGRKGGAGREQQHEKGRERGLQEQGGTTSGLRRWRAG